MAEAGIYAGELKEGFVVSRGLKFPKHTGIIKGKLRASLRAGTYEGREADAVLRAVRKGDRVLELGAGIGFMSTHIARARDVEAVHSFEANPHLIPYIQSVHAANDVSVATVHNAILGDTAGSVPFYVRKNLLASSMDRLDGANIIDEAQVEMRATQDVMRNLRPTVLVCDIEGAEADLIPSMDLSGLREAVIELHPQWIGPTGVNRIFSAFMDAGFAYFHRGSANKVVSFRRFQEA